MSVIGLPHSLETKYSWLQQMSINSFEVSLAQQPRQRAHQ